MEIITDEKMRCIKPIGRLDANSSNEFDNALMKWQDNGKDLIIDLSQCHYLSSAGIRILLKTNKRLHSSNNELFLAGVVPDVLQVLEIAGLKSLLHFETSVEDALATIQSRLKNKTDITEIFIDEHRLIYQPLTSESLTGQLCLEKEILSYHELGYSVGLGSLSEMDMTDTCCGDFFAVLDNCAGYLPLVNLAEPDFRMTSDPMHTGLTVGEAISFGNHPSATLKLITSGSFSYNQLRNVIYDLQSDGLLYKSVTLFLILGRNEQNPSLSLVLQINPDLAFMIKNRGMERLGQYIQALVLKQDFVGITFRLAELNNAAQKISLQEMVRQHLTFENIMAVEPINPDSFMENPSIWMFNAVNFVDGRTNRLTIQTKPGFTLEPHKAFLARLLYTDSSKLVVDELHGGYSAQTFHVTSFDHEGRKMRPTVLKISNRKLITRESERCKQFALPYIFNNSAVVLGAEFHGDTGALRYNFVGIGGESSQLKWLTDYYHKSDLAFLEPLFDKIFLHILKPWYGQPVSKTIYPFRDHDPTVTFFPHIYKTVGDLFSISADEKYLTLPETATPILNPYWFLKHEYKNRRDWSISYFTSICHGDLNMQNILLDENMNVYLIDFSETKPRSVISDFARLEAIFLIDNAPVENETDMADYLHFIRNFYGCKLLSEIPEISYSGKHSDKVLKNAALTLKMREYALASARGNADLVPYYIALLEWVLPVVCYYSMPESQKRVSLVVSSILCEKILAAELN